MALARLALARLRRSRTCKRLELMCLALLFFVILGTLYQILTTDKEAVLGWVGIKVRHVPPSGKRKLQSSVKQPDIGETHSRLQNRKHHFPPADSITGGDGLFLERFAHSNIHGQENNETRIAIGCAITTRNFGKIDTHFIGQTFPFLRTFLPSLCKTIEPGPYRYTVYLAYDNDDDFFLESKYRILFMAKVRDIKEHTCPEAVDLKVRFINCYHTGHPAWAQNDAMYEAYLDNADFFYRINDDTALITPGWTKAFMEILQNANPRNIGVVGPSHIGGNEAILVHDFVHSSHIVIFGFYYPRTFPDWWADDWITAVYGKTRSTKLPEFRAIHTGEKGTRYNHSWTPPEVLGNRVVQDRITLNRYLDWRKGGSSKHRTSLKGKSVISMSLYGHDLKYTYGAIRNAQIAPIVFPGWLLRFYVEKPRDDGATAFPQVPDGIVAKLRILGAEIVYVDTTVVSVPPMMWRFMVADDMEVENFIVRDVDSRLVERDAEIVSEWLESDRPFHCVRDHPSHRSSAVFGGLMGGRSRELRAIITQPWRELMKSYQDGYGLDIEFLSNIIWPRVRYVALCHDSVSCRQWPNAWPFPSPRFSYEHIGQVFDPFGDPRQIDIDVMKLYPEPWECTLREGESRGSWLLKQNANKRKQNANSVQVDPSKNWLTQVEAEFNDEVKRTRKSTIPYLTGRVVVWSMDYDIAPIRDIKTLLSDRGVKFIDKSLSPLCNTTNTCATNLDVITPENGLEADEQLAEKFYERYKNDSEMKQVTHFVCFRPCAMCGIYTKFEKSVVVVSTTRYEEGRITPTRWRQWNLQLYHFQKDHKNILAANNHYDAEYIRYFLGLDAEYLPNYCGYTGVMYNGSRPEFLVAPIPDPTFRQVFMDAVNATLTKSRAKVKVAYIDDLYPHGYNHSDLASHKGIIHVPYLVSDIAVCEQYRMGIPLFFPSLEQIARWHQKYNVIRNRTLNAERLAKGISIKGSPILASTRGRFDPNDDSSGMAVRFWLRYADFFQWPHVDHFDSVDQLIDLLQMNNLKMTSLKMKHFNRRFKQEIIIKWINVLNRTLKP